jgi:hypothetical protein
MKYILSLIISGALVVSGFGQTRNVLVGTNNAVVQPTNFWSADAVNARTGLGLGTAATNPATAFQPSSSALTNLASGNGGALSNLQATNLVGIIPASNISTVTFTNLAGTLTIAQGGTGATNAANARLNLGSTTVGDAVFIATNAAAARTALALGTAATSAVTSFQPADSDLTNLANNNAINLTNFPTLLLRTNGNGGGLTNLTAANITGIVALASNVTGVVDITNGGTGATNAATARSGLGLGFSALTNTNDSDFRTAIGLGNLFTNTVYSTQTAVFVNTNFFATNGQAVFTNLGTDYLEFKTLFIVGTNATNISFEDPLARTNFIRGLGLGPTNDVTFNNITISDSLLTLSSGGEDDVFVRNDSGVLELESSSQIIAFSPISFNNTTNAATTRANLGLTLPALTNTNNVNFLAAFFGANTNPVLVNTNGEVVSPTNFWQVAPLVTRFIESQPTTNFTTNIAAARNLHIHSLALSINGVTNTIVLPTNGATFNGDIALVVHQGPTNSTTRVRTAGSTNDLVTMTRFDESVEFVYYNGVWDFNHNVSFIEPIYFSGTNAAVNAAASRTNLGLGNISMGSNGVVVATNFYATNGEANFTNLQTDYLEFNNYLYIETTNTNVVQFLNATVRSNFQRSIGFGPTNSVTFSEVTTGNVSGSSEESSIQFDQDILRLSADNIINLESPTESVSTLTAKTNLVVEGFVNFTTNHTNSNPATNNQIQKFLQIRIGTNAFFLPLYQ